MRYWIQAEKSKVLVIFVRSRQVSAKHFLKTLLESSAKVNI